jgi:V8-like Glu-specific endopeptidase
MKQKLIAIAIMVLPFIGWAQDYSKEKPQPESYPFGKLGDTSRGVFGEDDRIEVTDAYGYSDFVRATAVMVTKKEVVGDKIYGWSLKERLSKIYKTDKFDEKIKYLDQPTCGSCTGFLIAPDVIVTAGHCVESMEDADKYIWIFDYTTDRPHNSKNRYITVPLRDQYTVKEILSAELSDNGSPIDYSVLRLDRKTDRDPYRFRTSGEIGLYNDVYMIGSPTGLPLKLVDNSYVVNTTPSTWFKNSLDGFPGNSGGPVFNSTGFIEGIHVRGAAEEKQKILTSDYYYDSKCDCVKLVEFAGTETNAGSQAHRITKIPNYLLDMAIYENIDYAIKNKDNKRLDKWLVYSWILGADYSITNGRLEFVALTNNNADALERMLDLSKDYGITNGSGQTLMHVAASQGKTDIVSYLLKKGASPNVKDNNGRTVLSYAASMGQSDIVKLLLDRGAKVDEVDNYGNTALHIAVVTGSMDMVKNIVDKGANLDLKNNEGKTACKLAKKSKQKAIAKYLKKAGKK